MSGKKRRSKGKQKYQGKNAKLKNGNIYLRHFSHDENKNTDTVSDNVSDQAIQSNVSLQQNRIKEKHRKLKIFFLILITIVVFAASFLFFAVRWMLDYWDQLTMDELLYQLNHTAEGTEQSIINNALIHAGIPCLLTLFAFIVVDRFTIKKRKYIFTALLYLFISGGMLYSTWQRVNAQLNVEEYVEENTIESEFIEENYVDPATVAITFPEQKRNLIYIYLESMECAYSDFENGGAFEDNYIPELTKLAEENEDFSGQETTLNGGLSTNCATWTMAGMFAETSGLPLKTGIGNNHMDDMETFFPNITTLGNILEDNGYQNMFMCGSDAAFGGRELYYTTHGNYAIEDYYAAIEEGVIPSWYEVWWGYEDEILFENAKDKITALAGQDQPFNFTMLTVDTHKEDGYVCDLCENQYDEQYANVIACSSRQVSAFIDWCKEQDWYENTTIILSGDHPTMDSDFCDDVDASYERKVYTCYINSAIETKANAGKREFSTFDDFPTTLAALGAEIDGDRLGLGTNLYSDEETLVEQYGIEKINEEISHKSEFMEKLAQIDWSSEALIAEEGEPDAYFDVFKYDEDTQTADIVLNGFSGVGDIFHSVSFQLSNAEGLTELTLLHDTGNEEAAEYAGTINFSDFVTNENETPSCHIIVTVEAINGEKYQVKSIDSTDLFRENYANLGDFLAWVRSNPNYVLLGSVNGDASFEMDIHAAYNMDKMGMERLEGREGISWCGIYDEGEMLQESGEDSIVLQGTMKSSWYGYYIYSTAELSANKNRSSIWLNRVNYAMNEPGYNFVVYDKSTNEVVDSVNFQSLMFNVDHWSDED